MTACGRSSSPCHGTRHGRGIPRIAQLGRSAAQIGELLVFAHVHACHVRACGIRLERKTCAGWAMFAESTAACYLYVVHARASIGGFARPRAWTCGHQARHMCHTRWSCYGGGGGGGCFSPNTLQINTSTDRPTDCAHITDAFTADS